MPASPGAAAADSAAPPAASTPEPPAGKTIAIRKRPLLLGSKVESTNTTAINELFGVETGNGTATVENVTFSVDHRVVQLLLVDQGKARRLGVSFAQKEDTRIMNGRERRRTSPVAGKSYIVELAEGGPQVTGPDGGAVSQKETDVVAAGFRHTSALLEAVPEGAVPLGAPLPALGEALKEDARQGLEGVRVFFGKVSATPVGTRDVGGTSALVFAVVLQVGFENEDSRLRMNLKGELLFRSDNAWPLGMEVSGPVAADGTVNGVQVHGRGTGRIKTVYAYP